MLSTPAVNPLVDAIAEFKVQSHNDQAEFGGVLGGGSSGRIGDKHHRRSCFLEKRSNIGGHLRVAPEGEGEQSILGPDADQVVAVPRNNPAQVTYQGSGAFKILILLPGPDPLWRGLCPLGQ
jgi:hypothetical protein